MTTRTVLRSLACVCLLLAGASAVVRADDGYDLWLRYRLVADPARRGANRATLSAIDVDTTSPTLRAACHELTTGLRGLLGADLPVVGSVDRAGVLVAGTPASSPVVAALRLGAALQQVGDEGYLIRTETVGGRRTLVIAGNQDVGVLYGAFALLRHIQTGGTLAGFAESSAPRIKLRLLDHWDNIDRSVERGYAGASLWAWDSLPGARSPRYRDYARANASIGLNGTVVTNVNSNVRFLTAECLAKVAALAGEFRPYGVRVYLTARFSSPIELGGLKTADPLDPDVRRWWQAKTDEIYRAIPDFGGFLIKANSEGQPGPQDYHRTHADGANMLADAVAPHGGIVMWRAFVYSHEVPADRVRQAYDEFTPLDGQFRDNVLVQVKNGPLDFQPREPFHPLFGAMPHTPLMMEFQITKEYLGQDTHLVYLGPYFEEVLRADTYARGPGSTVARVIDGSLHGSTRTGIAGVANVGSDRNWTGSQFNQANWYAFGRLAWDPTRSARDVADEWVRLTFSTDSAVVRPIVHLMMISREAVVNYMTPLGLAHIMATGHHYGPGAWADGGRPDWTPRYYHRADSAGLGFDRTRAGSDATAQYFPAVRDRYASRATVPDSVLLWFHHVGWGERLGTGRTLWDELVHRYDAGVDTVRATRRAWNALGGRIDAERFHDLQQSLGIQEQEARWWRDASLQYFQTFARRPLPPGAEPPAHPLAFYEQLRCPSNPRKPRCPQLSPSTPSDTLSTP